MYVFFDIVVSQVSKEVYRSNIEIGGVPLLVEVCYEMQFFVLKR